MRRFFCLILAFTLTIFPVQGAETKYVALTFDDGPSGRFTRRLLEGLEARNVTATFFLCGYRLETYGALAEDIHAGGHEIGLHGYTHDDMSAMSASQIRAELENTLALLPAGCQISLMRPPGGKMTDAVRQAAGSMGLSIVSWSVDPLDWATDSANKITQAVLEQVHDGDVILMHDMSDSSVDAAFAIIDALTVRGYQFITVSQLARIRDCTLEVGKTYSQFRSG